MAAYRKCGWGGQTESFQNVEGANLTYIMLTFQSLGGARVLSFKSKNIRILHGVRAGSTALLTISEVPNAQTMEPIKNWSHGLYSHLPSFTIQAI